MTESVTEGVAPAEPARRAPWEQRRDLFRCHFQKHPVFSIPAEELEAHFQGMPARYWERVSETDLVWGLETVHALFTTLAAAGSPGTAPVVRWRHFPERNFTEIMLCTWDRLGLLAKAAAAFSALRINILNADVFTRGDSIVLDVFRVCELAGGHISRAERLQEMTFLLEGALSEPPRFASLWACSRHKFLAPPHQMPPRIFFDNESEPDCTVLTVQASDRLGLLYDMLQALADAGVSVVHAVIDTEQALARNAFHLTDRHGHRIIEPSALSDLERCLTQSILS